MNSEQVRTLLQESVDEGYRSFNQKIVHTVSLDMMIGVRVPRIRQIARMIIKDGVDSYLNSCHTLFFYEEYLLYAIVVAQMKLPLSDKIPYIRSIVSGMDSWALCDLFCCSLKLSNDDKDKMLPIIKEYLKSDKEYEVRFGVVMLLTNYIDDSNIGEVISLCDSVVGSKFYYVQMGVAWCLSICFVKYPQLTYDYIKDMKQIKVQRMTISKICDSYRVSSQDKDKVKALRKG